MESKIEVRRRGRVIRAEIGDEAQVELDEKVLERAKNELDWDKYRRIMVFLPIARQREINTWPLVKWIWSAWPRIEVYVPRTEGKLMTAVRLEPDTELAENRWGIPEPLSSTLLPEDEALDLIITPLLAFDAKGHRVGYGHGYYDRFLNRHAAALRVGLGYEALVVTAGIAAEPHDVPVHSIITEQQRYIFSD